VERSKECFTLLNFIKNLLNDFISEHFDRTCDPHPSLHRLVGNVCLDEQRPESVQDYSQSII